MSSEEIRGVTWDLWGEELTHEQTIARIVNAGFPIKGGVALTMFAIVEGESGEYQRAWHINVARQADGTIARTRRDGVDYMTARSVDLGFLQRNVEVSPDELLEMDPDVVSAWVQLRFDAHPELAVPTTAAEDAYELWAARGFTPWFAYKPGTPEFHLKKRYGAKAFGNWLVRSFVGKDPDGQVPKLDYI